MKTVYRVLAYAIAALVAVQSALFGVAVMAAMRMRRPAAVEETVLAPVA